MTTFGTASVSDFNFDSSSNFVRSLSNMSSSSDLGRHSGWQRAMTPTGSVADQIMDRIDKHIGGISTDVRFGSTFVKPVSGLDSFALSTLPVASTLKPTDNANDDAASTSTVRLLRNFNPADVKSIDLDSDLGTETGDIVQTTPSKATYTANSAERQRQHLPEPDVDVSSVVAMQINEQYREVLNRKQAMDSYQSDNETVRTEDFANKYRSLQVHQTSLKTTANGTKASDTREIVDRANAIIDRYKHASPSGTTGSTAVHHQRQLTASASKTAAGSKLERTGASASASRNVKVLSPVLSSSQTSAELAPLAEIANARQATLSTSVNVHSTSHFNRNDIKRESERIKTEMDVERRKRLLQDANARKELISLLPAKQQIQAQPLSSTSRKESEIARERLHAKLTELEELNSEIKHLRTDRDRVADEVEHMNELLKRQQEDIKVAERTSKSSKTRSDELKHETTVLQAKRDATVNELEHLSSELSERRSKLLELEKTLNDRVRELRDYQSLGLSSEEVQKIIAERNDLFQLVSKIEQREMEKYELEKRLTVAHEDRLIEQEQFKERVADLEDELQTRVSQIEDLQKENRFAKEEIRNLKARLSEVQRDRDQFIQEKASEQERIRHQMHRDLGEIQKQSTDEIVSLKTHIADLRKQIMQMEKEIERRNLTIESLNAENNELQQSMKLDRDEHARKIRELELAKASEIKKLCEELRKERDSTLVEVEDRFQAERQRAISKLEQKHAKELEDNAATLADADKEINMLKEKIALLESNCDDLHTYYSKELDDKLRHALEQEHQKWQVQLDAAAQKAEDQIVKVKVEREKALQAQNEEMNALRKIIIEKDSELRRSAEEIERQKETFRVTLLEKQNELLKVKAEIRDACQTELGKIREAMQKDVESDKAKQEAALIEYRVRLEQAQLRLDARDEAQRSVAAYQCELLRGIVEEVNANCQVLAQAVGVTPKITNAEDIQVGNDNKAVVKTALATLKACCDEVREHALEWQRQLETLKAQLVATETSSHEDVQQLKALLEAQHTTEFNLLRDRLSKQHAEQIKQLAAEHSRALQNAIRMRDEELESTKNNLEGWKQETAQKLATSIQQDIRAEYERKLRELKQELRMKDQELATARSDIDRLTLIKAASSSGASGVHEESATKVIAMLQERLKQLREQNIELHRMLSAKRIGVSNTDLRLSLQDPAPIGSNTIGHHAFSVVSSAAARFYDREHQNGFGVAVARQQSPTQQISSSTLRPHSACSAGAGVSDRDRGVAPRPLQLSSDTEQAVPPLNLNVDAPAVDDYERAKEKTLKGIEKNYEHIRNKVNKSGQNRSGAESVASNGSAKPLNGHTNGNH